MPIGMNRFRNTLVVLAVAGLAVSAYLSFYYLRSTPVPCSTSFFHGCSIVQGSPYAKLLTVPLPLWGIAFYLAILVPGFRQSWFSAAVRRRALLALAAAGVLFSAYLTLLEAFIIRAWCFWCVTSAVIAAAIFLTAVLADRRERRPPQSATQ